MIASWAARPLNTSSRVITRTSSIRRAPHVSTALIVALVAALVKAFHQSRCGHALPDGTLHHQLSCSWLRVSPLQAVEQALNDLEQGGYTVKRTISLMDTASYLSEQRQQLQRQNSPDAPAAMSGHARTAHSPPRAVPPIAAPQFGQLPGRGAGGVYPSVKPRGTPERRSADVAISDASIPVDLDDDEQRFETASQDQRKAANPKADAANKKPKKARAVRPDPTSDPEPKKPRREAPHKSTKPPRPPEVASELPLPFVRTCNYAILVAMDREVCRRRLTHDCREGQLLDATSVTFTKEELMRMANDPELCHVDMYDRHAVAATQAASSYGADGWTNVHKSLLKRDVPWLPFLLERRNRKAVGGGASFSLAEPAGVAAARRLHQEAERCGFCKCGLVAPAEFAQLPMEDDGKGGRVRPPTYGLIADRSSTVQQCMSASAWDAYSKWERDCIAWEAAEKDYERRVEDWQKAHALWTSRHDAKRPDSAQGDTAAGPASGSSTSTRPSPSKSVASSSRSNAVFGPSTTRYTQSPLKGYLSASSSHASKASSPHHVVAAAISSASHRLAGCNDADAANSTEPDSDVEEEEAPCLSSSVRTNAASHWVDPIDAERLGGSSRQPSEQARATTRCPSTLSENGTRCPRARLEPVVETYVGISSDEEEDATKSRRWAISDDSDASDAEIVCHRPDASVVARSSASAANKSVTNGPVGNGPRAHTTWSDILRDDPGPSSSALVQGDDSQQNRSEHDIDSCDEEGRFDSEYFGDYGYFDDDIDREIVLPSASEEEAVDAGASRVLEASESASPRKLVPQRSMTSDEAFTSTASRLVDSSPVHLDMRAAALPSAAASTKPVWEVMLAGQFQPFDDADQELLEAAFARGDATASVRGGSREVTLCPPYVQRAPAGQIPCRERDVRRRISCPRLSLGGSSSGTCCNIDASTRAFPAGTKLRLRWVADDPWLYAVVTNSMTLHDVGATSEVQHSICISGVDEWVQLGEAAAVQVVD